MERKTRRKLTDNLGLKIIALVIGFLIWFFVTNSNDPIRSMTISGVPITMVNEDSIADIGKVVEPQGSGTVTLKVTERKSVLNRLSRTGSDFYVEADLENINAMSTVPLTVTCSNSSITWDEISISPSSLKVTLENKVEQAFAVNVTTIGDVASGYAVGTTNVLEGKNILIAGPESLIGIIGQVTAPVTVSGLGLDTQLRSVLKVYDKNGAELTDAQMNRLEFKDADGNLLTDHTVTVEVAMWLLKSDIPIRILTEGSPASGYKIGDIETIPASITLAGTQEAFDEIGSALTVISPVDVSGASEDVQVEIDLTETLSEYPELKLTSDQDPTVSVTVSIEKNEDQTLNVSLSSIELLNRPDNMKLVFTPADVLPVGVHATTYDAAAITADDISASVDLSPCAQEGTYEIPVNITLPEGYALSSDVTLKVSSSPVEAADSSADDSAESSDTVFSAPEDAQTEAENELTAQDSSLITGSVTDTPVRMASEIESYPSDNVIEPSA